MQTFFYNIVSILIGLTIIVFGISKIKQKKIAFGVIVFVHSILFIFFGIFGFCIPKDYSSITVLAMLAFTITLIIFTLLMDKKEPKDKKTKK